MSAPRALDLSDRDTARRAARRAGLTLKHRLGQNFLVDRAALEAIVDALAPERSDTVLEIGAGIGTLTAALAERAGRVVAVDLDPRCIAACRATLADLPSVALVHGDALHLDPETLGMPPGWLLAGNLPYQLTGALLQRYLELEAPPRRLVVLVQREVAHRLAAEGGGWSLATVAVRSVATVERLADLPPSSFEPPPAVHSSILRLTPSAAVPPALRPAMLQLARGAFQQRRKTLRHALAHALGDAQAATAVLGATGIDPGRRPETLDLGEWTLLTRAASEYPGRS